MSLFRQGAYQYVIEDDARTPLMGPYHSAGNPVDVAQQVADVHGGLVRLEMRNREPQYTVGTFQRSQAAVRRRLMRSPLVNP